MEHGANCDLLTCRFRGVGQTFSKDFLLFFSASRLLRRSSYGSLSKGRKPHARITPFFQPDMSLPAVFTLVPQSPARPEVPHNSAHRAFAYCVFSFALHQLSNAKQRPVNPMYYNVFAKISETLRPASTPAASTILIPCGSVAHAPQRNIGFSQVIPAMGYNLHGDLGEGTKTNRPEQIVPSGVTAIAAGFDHSLFLKSDGSAWGMGFNYDGELGAGAGRVFGTYTNVPEQIVSSNVVAIAGGG